MENACELLPIMLNRKIGQKRNSYTKPLRLRTLMPKLNDESNPINNKNYTKAVRRYFCCGSLLSVFGIRVSVTFHLQCVHIFFVSVLGC